jgi:phosphoserine phosphatase RsbU/P
MMQVSPAPRTLIADDQQDVLDALRLLLKQEGFQVEAVNTPSAVVDTLEKRRFDVLLMDLNYARDTTSGEEGLDLIARVQAIDSSLPVVVMTAWGSVPLAVEAMRRGVRDFVQKPWDNTQLLQTLQRQVIARREEERRRVHATAAQADRAELEEAIAIQRGLLPRQIPRMPGYDASVSWQPATTVSGDYADVLRIADDHLALCVADVAGKGLPAALLMSNLQAAVRTLAPEKLVPSELMHRLNRMLCANVPLGRFVTLFYGIVNARTRSFDYTNAGHTIPILVRADGACERLESGGPVLGVFAEPAFDQGSLPLQSGDRVVIFTDGITEAENEYGIEFGEQRLLDLICGQRQLRASDLEQRIVSAASQWGQNRFQDDATLLVLAVD